MANHSNENTFGHSLKFFRNRAHDDIGKPLSQENLAKEINKLIHIGITRDSIYKWEKGLRTIRQDNRPLLVSIIKILAERGGVTGVLQANQLLKAGGYSDLEESEISQIHFADAVQEYVNRSTSGRLSEGPIKIKNPPGSGGFSPNFDPMNFQRTDRFYYHPPVSDNGDNSIDEIGDYTLHEDRAPYFGNSFSPFFGAAPSLPSLFVGRGDDLRALKERLNLFPENKNQNIQVLTAMRGWPGVGKTCTAAALAHEQDVIQKYPDGILWASLGTSPDVLASLITWGKALHIQAIEKARDVREASMLLAGWLREKRLLLIIDDVWNAEDAQPLFVGGRGCATLVTTRSQEVASRIAGTPEQVYLLGVLSDTFALELLQKLAPHVVAEHPAETETLLSKLEGLPLALQVAGRLLQSEYSTGFGVNELIKEISEGSRLLQEKVPIGQDNLSNETTPSVAALLYKSLDHLDPFVRHCYAHLGVLAPSPAKFDQSVLSNFWKTPDPKPILRTLVGRGLLEYLPQEKLYQMHSLLVMLAKSLWDEINLSGQPE